MVFCTYLNLYNKKVCFTGCERSQVSMFAICLIHSGTSLYRLLVGDNLPFNSLRPRDTIWRHISWSTLVQVVACCLTKPSHYLNQCWLTINYNDGNFASDTLVPNYKNGLSILSLEYPRGQRVKTSLTLWEMVIEERSSVPECPELAFTTLFSFRSLLSRIPT